jgi:hypothetical protein
MADYHPLISKAVAGLDPDASAGWLCLETGPDLTVENLRMVAELEQKRREIEE